MPTWTRRSTWRTSTWILASVRRRFFWNLQAPWQKMLKTTTGKLSYFHSPSSHPAHSRIISHFLKSHLELSWVTCVTWDIGDNNLLRRAEPQTSPMVVRLARDSWQCIARLESSHKLCKEGVTSFTFCRQMKNLKLLKVPKAPSSWLYYISCLVKHFQMNSLLFSPNLA